MKSMKGSYKFASALVCAAGMLFPQPAQAQIPDPSARVERVMRYYMDSPEATIPAVYRNYDDNIAVEPYAHLDEISDQPGFVKRTNDLLLDLMPAERKCPISEPSCRDISFIIVEDANNNDMIDLGETAKAYSETPEYGTQVRASAAVDVAMLAYIDPAHVFEIPFLRQTALVRNRAFCRHDPEVCGEDYADSQNTSDEPAPSPSLHNNPSHRQSAQPQHSTSQPADPSGTAGRDNDNDASNTGRRTRWMSPVEWCRQDQEHEMFCGTLILTSISAVVYCAATGDCLPEERDDSRHDPAPSGGGTHTGGGGSHDGGDDVN